ncbi:hypothetical protein CPB84DRAFT_1750049 [Gymnopilus junonius]|uniref:Uncharacterized protein n=1 Tax=Gymnopilus junonius TaxID=109634 RepID=A0A9P5NFV2_GYMJU|nr:hypothetical protein CPB84DRAFT_1750049 [Gymnopilus junonius]
MCRVGKGRKESDGTLSKMNTWVELLTRIKCKLPTVKESCPSKFHGSIEGGVESDIEVSQNAGELLKDVECDGELRLPVLFPMELLNSLDDTTENLRFASFEWKTFIDMEGTNGREVGFNCFGLEATLAKGRNPLEEDARRGREIFSRRVEELRVELSKVNKGLLPRGVGFSSTGGKAVEKVEGCKSGDISVHFIPERWDFIKEDVRLRCGASSRSFLNWKQEAASASKFCLDGIQIEWKENFRQAPSKKIRCMMGIE